MAFSDEELDDLDEFSGEKLRDHAEMHDPKAAEVLRQREAGLRTQKPPTPSKVRLLPEPERRRRSIAIGAWHHDWVMRQVAKGVDGPCPPGSPEGSDYNQHFADMEASPEDQDEFWDGVAAINAGANYADGVWTNLP